MKPEPIIMAKEVPTVLESEIIEEIKNRDDYHDWADRLAYSIAPESVIGEHSSLNNPWSNALDEAELLHARAARAEAGRERMRAALAEMVDWHERGDMDASTTNWLRFRQAIERARAALEVS